MLAAHLHYLLEAQPPADLGRLVEHLPREWIEQAVQETCKASIRRRRLPAEQVVWLVIALVLMTVFNQFSSQHTVQKQMEYSQFLDEVKQGQISKVT